MENREIPDENIAASRWQDSLRPQAGRLNNVDGVWCPDMVGDTEKECYLQVELPAGYFIYGVATQGSPLNDAAGWVTAYQIQYSMDGQNFRFYEEDDGTVEVSFN